MDPFIVMVGIVFLAIVVGVLALVVGLSVAGLVAFAAGLLGHPLGRSQDRHTQPHRRPPVPFALRTAVLERDKWQCVYCGGEEDLEIDHIIPVSRGGATTFNNLETLCQSCNQEKGAR